MLIDEGENGANWNHRRALEWAAAQIFRVVVVEDDAEPVPNFLPEVEGWLQRYLIRW